VCTALQLAPPAGATPWLARVVDHLEADLAYTPPLDELARLAGVHASQLSRVFRKAYGESVGAYLRRRRLEHADAQLARGATSLADLALRAGYCDQAHFTRAYARHFGMTPGRRRRVIRS
jgi:AraC-like DNA-binding protein